MGNSYHLNRVERDKILKIAKEKGYQTQTELAEAIAKYYNKDDSENVRTYLNQVLNGRRGASLELKNAIIKTLKDDSEISFLKKNQKREATNEIKSRLKAEEGLKELLDNYFTRLYNLFNSSDLQGKAIIIKKSFNSISIY